MCFDKPDFDWKCNSVCGVCKENVSSPSLSRRAFPCAVLLNYALWHHLQQDNLTWCPLEMNCWLFWPFWSSFVLPLWYFSWPATSGLNKNCARGLLLNYNAQQPLFCFVLELFWGPYVATLQRRVKEKKKNLHLAAFNTFCHDWMQLSMKFKA